MTQYQKQNRICAGLAFAISFLVYGNTVAPTVSFWDCGEFIASSYLLGIPHPPGAPLYILVGRLMTMLPFFQDVALSVNVFSVLMSALTVMLTYLVTVRLIRIFTFPTKEDTTALTTFFAAAVGALTFAFTDSFWFNAVEAEVYAFSMFFTVVVVWLILVWLDYADEPKGDRILLLISYSVGLAIGVHLLNVLALPAIFLIVYFRTANINWRTFARLCLAGAGGVITIYPGLVKGVPMIMANYSALALAALAAALLSGIYYTIVRRKRAVNLILTSLFLVLLGYSSYSALYVRSGLNPIIDENDPETPARFADYLNREQYGDIPFVERRAPLWDYQIRKMYVRYFGWQFIGKSDVYGPDGFLAETFSLNKLWALPFLVGLLGMVAHFRRDWPRALAVLTLFIMTGLAITLYLNQVDPQPRERDYTYVGSFFAFSLWIGIGCLVLLEELRNIRQRHLRKGLLLFSGVLLVVGLPVNMLRANYESHDRTGNYLAWDYSYNILQSCEPNAILFTNGDNDTFPIWYLQYVEGIRTDVRVVCLSLLNTPWYIKQLRDLEPRVPIHYSDAEIDNLRPTLWPSPKRVRIEVAPDIIKEHLAEDHENSIRGNEFEETGGMVFNLAANASAPSQPLLLVQDRMVLHILAANEFKQPVYFSVTVGQFNMLGLGNPRGLSGLRNYLRMDGMAFRVLPYGVGNRQFVSAQNVENNLRTQFRYRNLDNPEVHYDERALGLLQNYRIAFFNLVNSYQRSGLDEKAADTLDFMTKVMPETTIPYPNFRTEIVVGQMYAQAGRPTELEKRLNRVWTRRDLSVQDRLNFAALYVRELQQNGKAEKLALQVWSENPGEAPVFDWLIAFYSETGQAEKAVNWLEKWLEEKPGDQKAQFYLHHFNGRSR